MRYTVIIYKNVQILLKKKKNPFLPQELWHFMITYNYNITVINYMQHKSET